MVNNVVKIYELRSLGYSELHTQLQQVKKDFEAIKQAKLEAEKGLANATSTSDAAKYRAELQKIKLETAAIEQQAKQLQADMKVQQAMRQADINQLKQQVEQQKITAAAQKATNQQAKADAEAARIATQQQTTAINAQSGSYAALVLEAKQFYALLKATPQGGSLDFQGQLYSYDQAIAKYKELTAAEQAFRRQFTQDQTLVGEYTTGIVQAFKAMGLDDLIGGQVTRANQRLSSLASEANELKTAFQQIKQQGQTGFDTINNQLNAMAASTGGLDARFEALDSIIRQTGTDGNAALQLIEQRLIANATEAGTLQRQVGLIQAELRGTGDIGDRITASLKNGFKEVTGQVATFVAGYFGIQAALQGIISTFDKTVRLDSLHAAMKVVSGDADQLARNEEFLRAVTERLGLEYLGTAEAFKSFYASSTQAGLGADQTRQIFESATTASAALKLSQEQTNGVLLAFGQIASKGKVQAEELRGQIGERLPGAFAIAARAMGVTQQQLNKMMDTGQLAANDFLPKFAAELQKTFGGDTTKNIEGLQATINRFSNQFTEFLNNNSKIIATFLTAIIGATTGILGLLSYLPQAIALLAAYTIGWGLLNKELFIQRALTFAARYEIVLLNAQLILGRVALFAVTAAQYLFTAALAACNLVIRIVRVSLNAMGVSMGALPVKILIALIGGLAIAFSASAKATDNAANKLKGFNAELAKRAELRKAANDIENEAVKIYQQEAAQLEALYKVATDNNITLETRRAAIQKLIDQYPEYFGNLNAETATVAQLKDGYDKLSASILENARVAASAKLAGQRQAEAQQAAEIQGLVETQFRIDRTKKNGDFNSSKLDIDALKLTDEQKDALYSITTTIEPDPKGNIEIFGVVYNYNDLIKSLSDETQRRKNIASQYTELALQFGDEAAKKKAAAEAAAKAALIGRINNRDVTAAEVDALIKSTQAELEALKLNDPKRKELIDKIAEYQKILDEAKDKKTKVGADKLTVDERNEGNSLDARLKNDIARLELEFAELRKTHELSVAEEVDYLTRLNAINNHYAQLKIEAIHGNNAAEQAARAELNLKIIDNDIDTANKIKEVYKKDFDNRSALLKKSIETTVAQIKQGLSEFQADPTVSHTDRAQAAADANGLIIEETKRYYNELEALAVQDKQKVEIIEQEKQKAIAELIKESADIPKQINAANIEDIEEQGKISISIRRKQYAEIRTEILNNTALTEEQRKAQLETFQRAEEREVAAIELDVLNKIVAFKKGLFDKGLISEEDYDAVLAAQQQKAEEVAKLTVTNITKPLDQADLTIKGFINTLGQLFDKTDLFNKEIGKSGISLGYVLAQSFDLAKQAMNNYFDAQANRINQEKELQFKRLDIEKEQVESRAQSNAEKESLDKQYEAKREAITKAAGEKLKKQKKAEVLISLAAEEANIAVMAAANPANAVTFGAAGLTQFAILSGIAIAKAALQIAAINSQQFAFGGNLYRERQFATGGNLFSRVIKFAFGGNISTEQQKARKSEKNVLFDDEDTKHRFSFGGNPDTTTTRGGRVKGRSHAQGGNPFMWKGRIFEDEIDEINIVRTKNVNRNQIFQVVGTQSQIASALNVAGGGKAFESGAKIKKFAEGGTISSFNKYPDAPQFVPSSYYINQSNNNADVVEKLEEMNQKLDAHTKATSERIDRMEVVQVTDTVTAAQKKAVRQSNIGTLGKKA